MKEVDALFSHIERLLNIPREDLEVSRSFWKIQTFNKKDYFNEYGNVCKYLGFVIDGVFRTYYIDEYSLKENTIFLYSNNDFITAFRSLITQNPCIYYTQSIISSTIVYIHIDNLNYLFEHYKSWEKIGRFIAEQSFNSLLERTEMHRLDAKDRYIWFLGEYSNLQKKIPQCYIASFLGLENSSLCRIKKKINFIDICK